jgi:hypothetical protein
MKFLIDKQQIGIENQSSIGVLLQVTKQVDYQFEVSTVGTCEKQLKDETAKAISKCTFLF